MLQALRRQTGSWIVKILLGFLILSFAVWGINDIFLGERDPVVAEVGGVKITSSQLNREFRRELARVSPIFGGRLDRGAVGGIRLGVGVELHRRAVFGRPGQQSQRHGLTRPGRRRRV